MVTTPARTTTDDTRWWDAPTCAVPPAAVDNPPVKRLPLVVAAVIGVGLSVYVWSRFGARNGLLLTLGGGLGFALFHARFGFTSAWRQLVAVGNGAGVRAHAVLLGTAATVIAVVAGTGLSPFGSDPAVTPAPIGLALLVGSVLFGLGMQVGGACASGTLYAVGGGQSAILLTLGGFVAGSTFYTWQSGWFTGWAAFDGVVLSDHVGWIGSWAITVVAVAVLWTVGLLVQRRRTPPPVEPVPTSHGAARVWRGSWSLTTGAVVLGVLAGAVFLVAGSIWGITTAFTLWGARLLQLFGVEPQTWAYWQEPSRAATLQASVWTERTTLTDVGIMLGAAVAASLAGVWVLRRRIAWRVALGAVLGGIVMGIGARLAGGCNIGAYLGGISTGNLAGWLWGVGALAGTWLGLRVRPLFGLGVPKPGDGVC